MVCVAACLDITVLQKEPVISITFWKLPSDLFPILIQIITFLIRHYLWNLVHGLKHYQELRDMCQQDVISLSLDQLHSIVICQPVFLIINEKAFSKEAQSATTRPFLVSKESGASLSSQRAFLITDSLLNKTLVSDCGVPDTTRKNHLWLGGAHSSVEKADLNQIITQINNYFQTLIKTVKENYRAL